MDHQELIRQIELSLPNFAEMQPDTITLTDTERDLFNLISTIPRGRVSTIIDTSTKLGIHSNSISWICRRSTHLEHIPFHRLLKSCSSHKDRNSSMFYVSGPDGMGGAPVGEIYHTFVRRLQEEGIKLRKSKRGCYYLSSRPMETYRYQFK